MIWEMDIRGEYRFSSRMKQNKKAKICFVIHIATSEKEFFFYIYAVIVKQKIYKRSSNYYWERHTQRQRETHTQKSVTRRESRSKMREGERGTCTEERGRENVRERHTQRRSLTRRPPRNKRPHRNKRRTRRREWGEEFIRSRKRASLCPIGALE